MRVRVQAYAGHTANERPLRFTDGTTQREVRVLVERWCDEAARYFRVQADDGHTYVLRYLPASDHWELCAGMAGRGPMGVV